MLPGDRRGASRDVVSDRFRELQEVSLAHQGFTVGTPLEAPETTKNVY